MSKHFLALVAIPVSLVLVAGCAASPDDGDRQPEAIQIAQQALDPALIQVLTNATAALITYGHCDHDGYVLQGGEIYRLGADVGPDVTGLTTPNENICRNAGVWTHGVTYACNANEGTDPAGTYTGAVPEIDEILHGALVRHPGSVATAGLNFGHALLSLCDTPSHKDYHLVSIECCAAAATPPFP